MDALKTWFMILTLTCGIIVTMAFESGLLRVLAAPIQQGDPEDPMRPDLVAVIVSCGPPVRVKITNQGTRNSVPYSRQANQWTKNPRTNIPNATSRTGAIPDAFTSPRGRYV
jgi:hypothetical protein